MSFHNPYHFIPVKKDGRIEDLPVEEFKSDKQHQVTHDHYRAKVTIGEEEQPVYSGRLLCKLTTEDPVVIGAAQEELPNGSKRILPFELDGRPAMPSSTLRGMISSLAEAASNSSLRVLDNRLFSRRADMQESPSAIGMIVEVEDPSAPTGKKLKLRPLTLPTLRCNKDGDADIPSEYQNIFTWPVLKVYVDGYRGGRVTRNSFLGKSNPDSFSADNKQFWYIKLAGKCKLNKDNGNVNVQCTAPYIKEIKNNRTKKINYFLVGQHAASDPKPYDELTSAEKNDPDYVRGILRVLGVSDPDRSVPNTKKHEIFIPYPEGKKNAPLNIDHALETFYTLAKERTDADGNLPYHVKGAGRNAENDSGKREIRFRDGDLVFFRPDKSDSSKVAEISISSIWRKTAGGKSHDFFKKISPELLPFGSCKREFITMAEQLFGFVEEQAKDDKPPSQILALAGRVRFSSGRLDPNTTDPVYDKQVLLKILDTPKPPCPSMYFKDASGSGRYIAKKDLTPQKHRPQGRKYYLHRHKDQNEPWKTLRETKNLKQKSCVRPISAGRTFFFHIDFDNLSESELELLFYALRPALEFRHKIGMGKSIGLGKVRIDPLAALLVDRQLRYCDEINLLASNRYHKIWLAEDAAPGAWPTQYAREKKEAVEAEDNGNIEENFFNELHKKFRDRMDEDIRTALELLGDPDKITHPVHTPQIAGRTTGPDLEKETYRWFVANDRARNKQYLKPLDKASDNIEPLS